MKKRLVFGVLVFIIVGLMVILNMVVVSSETLISMNPFASKMEIGPNNERIFAYLEDRNRGFNRNLLLKTCLGNDCGDEIVVDNRLPRDFKTYNSDISFKLDKLGKKVFVYTKNSLNDCRDMDCRDALFITTCGENECNTISVMDGFNPEGSFDNFIVYEFEILDNNERIILADIIDDTQSDGKSAYYIVCLENSCEEPVLINDELNNPKLKIEGNDFSIYSVDGISTYRYVRSSGEFGRIYRITTDIMFNICDKENNCFSKRLDRYRRTFNFRNDRTPPGITYGRPWWVYDKIDNENNILVYYNLGSVKLWTCTEDDCRKENIGFISRTPRKNVHLKISPYNNDRFFLVQDLRGDRFNNLIDDKYFLKVCDEDNRCNRKILALPPTYPYHYISDIIINEDNEILILYSTEREDELNLVVCEENSCNDPIVVLEDPEDGLYLEKSLAELEFNNNINYIAFTFREGNINTYNFLFCNDNCEELSSKSSNFGFLSRINNKLEFDKNDIPVLQYLKDLDNENRIFGLFFLNFGDSDGDGILDENDNCLLMENPAQDDSDDDGIGDVCEVDTDKDGIDDESDNCLNIANQDQIDIDGDGVGDDCDDDIDGDEVANLNDNCPLVVNQEQGDKDSDGIGDFCDEDADKDGIDDNDDNCPNIANADQVDTDGDGIGDVCEQDRDRDGVIDDFDNCPDEVNIDQEDLDFDGVGDVCDEDIDIQIQFIRGDANMDGRVDISDAVRIINYLFGTSSRRGINDPTFGALGEITCLDAADANDNRGVDIGDPIYILLYLFHGDDAPPAPFPDLGFDETEDDTDCEAYDIGLILE